MSFVSAVLRYEHCLSSSPCFHHPGRLRLWSWRGMVWRTCSRAEMGKCGWCWVPPCLGSTARWAGIGWWWSADCAISSRWSRSCWWWTSSPWQGWVGTGEGDPVPCSVIRKQKEGVGEKSMKYFQEYVTDVVPLFSHCCTQTSLLSLRRPAAHCSEITKLNLFTRGKSGHWIFWLVMCQITCHNVLRLKCLHYWPW